MSVQTVSFFGLESRAGLDLCREVEGLVASLGFSMNEVPADPQPIDYLRHAHNADVVVLDATIEETGEHNYHLALPQPQDRIFVVSRTPLPLNFYGLREGIEDKEPAAPRMVYPTPFFPEEHSNGEILRWLRLQLESCRREGPRPIKGILRSSLKGSRTSLDALDARRASEGSIFISFRSTVDAAVRQLSRRITAGAFPGVEAQPVRYFPPGILSLEIMPEQRRWSVLSGIDRFIGPASELWVFESPDYYDSWWTLGELVTVAYRAATGYRGRRPPKVRIYDPETEKVSDAPEGFLPRLTKEARRRVARNYANSDAMAMSPESRLPMHFFAQVPLIGRLKYFRDPVWSGTFWDDFLLDCPHCRQIGARGSKFSVEDFLFSQGPNFHRISRRAMADAVRRGRLDCRNSKCGAPFEIVAFEKPRFLWIPPRAAKFSPMIKQLFGVDPSTPDDPHLVPLPTVVFSDVS